MKTAVAALALLVLLALATSYVEAKGHHPGKGHHKGGHHPGKGHHKKKLFIYGAGATTVQAFQTAELPVLNAKYGVSINYLAIGSGAGRADFIAGSADYAFSDVPLSSLEEVSLKGAVKFTLPFVLETISVFVNLPGVTTVKLTANLLSSIFQALITKWDDPAILAVNSGLKVPAGTAIKPIHRIDTSGTTALFTGYLQGYSTNWKLAAGGSITWPASFLSGNGSSGVATLLSSTPYGIAYLGTGVGKRAKLTEVQIANAAGNYLVAGQSDVYASVPRPLPSATTSWAGVSLLGKPGPNTWPIVSFEYLVVRQDATHVGPKGRNGGLLKSYVTFLNSAAGQGLVGAFDFYTLPTSVSTQNLAAIGTMIIRAHAIVPF